MFRNFLGPFAKHFYAIFYFFKKKFTPLMHTHTQMFRNFVGPFAGVCVRVCVYVCVRACAPAELTLSALALVLAHGLLRLPLSRLEL
jgi:hypothetical protein